MATATKIKLSGSTDGKGIDVAATSIGSGTTIHTAVSGTTDLDLVTLFCANTHSADVVLTVGWGGTSDPDIWTQTIAAGAGLVLVAADLPLQNGQVVKAAGATGNVLQVYGYVNRLDY